MLRLQGMAIEYMIYDGLLIQLSLPQLHIYKTLGSSYPFKEVTATVQSLPFQFHARDNYLLQTCSHFSNPCIKLVCIKDVAFKMKSNYMIHGNFTQFIPRNYRTSKQIWQLEHFFLTSTSYFRRKGPMP